MQFRWFPVFCRTATPEMPCGKVPVLLNFQILQNQQNSACNCDVISDITSVTTRPPTCLECNPEYSHALTLVGTCELGMRLMLSNFSVWRINSVCRAYWGWGCYNCDVRDDITVAGRILQTCRKLQNRKTAVCNCSFRKFNKTRTSPHGISGFAVLVDQHIAKKYLIHSQFYSSKIPQRK